MTAAITVIGIGDDGCASLTSKAVGAVESAQVLAGSQRQLSFFPQFRGQNNSASAEGLQNYLNSICEASYEHNVCVLASGDPLFFGLGKRLAETVEPEHLHFIPSPSSAQLAFAALGIPWADARTLSVHGRPLQGLVSKMQQGHLFALLTDRVNHPAAIAQHLLKYHEQDWVIHVCERLGGTEQKISRWSVTELAQQDSLQQPQQFDALNMMVLQREQHCRPWGGYPNHCPDTAYQKRMPRNGLITRQEVRAIAVAQLQLHTTSVVWDIGTGSGSIAIEAAKQAWQGEVCAIESTPESVDICRANAEEHRVDHLQVIAGLAPDALSELPAPDAIFIGGSRGRMTDILSHCWHSLKPGGRLVISAVTLDTVSETFTTLKAMGLQPEVRLISIARSKPVAHYTGYSAENPIHLFSLEKAEQPEQTEQ